jgi:hypothetical protein
MRIGIVPVLSGVGGGLYQYGLTMLQALQIFRDEGGNDEFVIFAEGLPKWHSPLTNHRFE